MARKRKSSIFDTAFPNRRKALGAPAPVARGRAPHGDEFEVVMGKAWQLVRQGYDMHQALEIAWKEYDAGQFGPVEHEQWSDDGIRRGRKYNFSPATRAKSRRIMRDAWGLVRNRGMSMSQALRQAWKMNGDR